MKRLQNIIFSLALLLTLACSTAQAKYSPIPFIEMVMHADAIVYGTIHEVGEQNFTLHVLGQLDDAPYQKVMTIKKFRDWTCAQRWTKYKKGQSVLLFLTLNDGNYHIMSAGGEGEMPIYEDDVYINGYYTFNTTPETQKENANTLFNAKSHQLYGANYYGSKVALKSFTDAIKTARKCFEASGDTYKMLCSNDAIEKYKARTGFHTWLIHQLQKN